jgi:hypothetical protein
LRPGHAARRCSGHYLLDLLPSMLLTGMGVGMTLPTLVSASTTALPAARFGTGSALVNGPGQQGAPGCLGAGVALFVTILRTPATAAEAVTAFRYVWLFTAGASVLAAVTASFVHRPGPAGRGRRGGPRDGRRGAR